MFYLSLWVSDVCVRARACPPWATGCDHGGRLQAAREAAGAPAGAIAQVMGHKPSATAEGYRPRSVDALRPYLEKIEAHILEQAGVTFDAAVEPGKLRVVA